MGIHLYKVSSHTLYQGKEINTFIYSKLFTIFMTKFVKYQHVERIDPDNLEIQGLLDGKVYVTCKLDGTNASMGLGDDGQIWYGKRTARLGFGDDNQGFKQICSTRPKYELFFQKHPDVILYGEWLKPHTIKYYPSTAWDKFYVFDVCEQDAEGNITKYLEPSVYIPWLQEFGIEYVPVYVELDNPSIADLKALVEQIHFLTDDEHFEEGIVVKRYDYVNPYGRTTWGKIVRAQFKVDARRPSDEPRVLEQKIIEDLLTAEFIKKEYAKILADNDGNFSPFLIPKTLGIVYHEFIADEINNIIKKYKKPVIDFRALAHECDLKVKRVMEW